MTSGHTEIVPVVGLALLLWLSSTLVAADQDSLPDANHSSPAQSPPADSGAHRAGCQSHGEADNRTNQGPCIVDLKPGDVRLFAPSESTAGKFSRWLDLQTVSVGIQYLFVKNGLGVNTPNVQQYQVAARGRFKFDAKGNYSINAGLYTGTNFIAGFNNSGLGTEKARSNLYLKHLYLRALPIPGVEVQYGGLDIWHDESTDITGYAYNGYIVGERLSIKRPRELFFDDISVAFGEVADLNAPNVFRRLHRITQSNFHRFMLKKDIGERAWVSVDYAFQSGVQTWREATRLRTTELRAIDTFHAEVYEISRPGSGYGFAVYGEKSVGPKFIVGGGYADIDRPLLNSDRYGVGKRLFLTTKMPINEAFSVLVFATQAIGHDSVNVPQQRIDIGLYYNVLYLLRKTRSSSSMRTVTQAARRRRIA